MRILFLNILIMLCGAAFAQPHYIGLEESKKAALDYSNAIKNSKLQIQSAQFDKKSATANYYPSVSATAVGMYGFKDFISAIPSFLDKGINNLYFGGLTATEPVYMGGKINTANKLANLQIAMRETMAKQSVDSVLLMTEQKYWIIVQLQQQYKTLLANEKLLDAILKQQQDMLSSGLIARNDLLKVKVRRAQLLLDKSKLENGKKVAVFDFTMYIGIAYDSLLTANDSLTDPPALSSQFTSPETALQQNTTYDLLKKNTQAEQLQTKLTKADYMPSISVGVSTGDFGSIANSAVGNRFMPIALGTVSIPISDRLWGSGKYKMKQRQINENIAQNNLSDGERQLKVGILQNWYDLSDAYQQIDFAHENMKEAEENLKVTKDNYASGFSDITQLLDAQAAYQQAASDLVSAYANYHIKQVSYLYITGQLQ